MDELYSGLSQQGVKVHLCYLCCHFQKAEKVSGKKSKFPVQLDIGNMLAALEKKQQTHKDKQDVKPVILSGGPQMLLRSPFFFFVVYVT